MRTDSRANSPPLLPFLENEKHGRQDEDEADQVVPFEILLEIEDGEDGEHDQGDDLLDRLELSGAELGVAEAVGRCESDGPPHQESLAFAERFASGYCYGIPKFRAALNVIDFS